MSIESVMRSNHLILCCSLLLLPSFFSSIKVWETKGQLFASNGWSIEDSTLASVLLTNIHAWFPLRLTGWISLLSKGLSRVFSSTTIQFSSVAQLCLTLCDCRNCSTQGFPVYHQLPELAQTHVHWIDDTMQSSHLLSSPSPPAFNLSQHQDLF